MSSPASAPFPFMLLPKELRLIVYEFLAEEIHHAVFYTGDGQYHVCYEPLEPSMRFVSASVRFNSAFGTEPCKLGAVTLIIPSVPGLALLSTCRAVSIESRPIFNRGLSRCIRRPPRVVISYSNITRITSSPFWTMLRRNLQTIVGRRSDDVPDYQPNCRTKEVYARYDTPCVIKTIKSQTKKVDWTLRHMKSSQRFVFNKFLKHAQRHYRFLEEIGVRKRDPSRVELQLLLAGDTNGRISHHMHNFRHMRPSELKIRVLTLDTEINCPSEIGHRRREAMWLFQRLGIDAEINDWLDWIPFSDAVKQADWNQHWSKG